MPWTFYNANGQRLSSAATNISVLDIDGATDIGAAIVNEDLFIIDDGAGGTNRSVLASRIKTYIGSPVSVFYGEFTKNTADATDTTTVISSVGFTVKALIFFFGQHNAVGRAGWGMATSADQGTLVDDEVESAGRYYIPKGLTYNYAIESWQSGSNVYEGAVTTFGSDGFTVTWLKTGSPTGTLTVMYMAIG